MDVKGINSGLTSTIKNDEKHQATIQRVQSEFINQLYQGKSEAEAFKNSLKAIDEKYNPQEDKFQAKESVGMSHELCGVEKLGCAKNMMKAVKLPNGKTVLKWLNFIAEALPILLQILDKLPKSEPKPTEGLDVAA